MHIKIGLWATTLGLALGTTSCGSAGTADATNNATTTTLAVCTSDSDRDGISNTTEGLIGCGKASITRSGNLMAQTSIDLDGDGTPDSTQGSTDTDKDGTPNFLDLDSDGDGISDHDESRSTCPDTDKDGRVDSEANCSLVSTLPDSDGDEVADSEDLDSNNDGHSDHDEGGAQCLDSNKDGECDNKNDEQFSPATDSNDDGKPDYTESNGSESEDH